jgi:hypothetical protein
MKKKSIAILVLVITVICGLTSCRKDSNGQKVEQLQASKVTGVKKGEPILFAFSQANSGALVNWSVAPATYAQISNWGNTASIKFTKSGTYTVDAVYNNTTARSTVTVNDSVYLDTVSGNELPFVQGEKIAIHLIRDSIITPNGIQYFGLWFGAVTANTYPCVDNSILTESNSNPNNVSFYYKTVFVPTVCTLPYLFNARYGESIDLVQGTSPITIKFGNNVYTGSITRTGNNYTVYWPNTSEVVFLPTSL